jgi:hypothetical protein
MEIVLFNYQNLVLFLGEEIQAEPSCPMLGLKINSILTCTN